jgi:sugar (pentulose or hexulose) kinase
MNSVVRADLVIGIDSSTQSTKAFAYDAAGNIVACGSAPIPLSSPAPGCYEQDAGDWWTSLCTALGVVWQTVDPTRIAALAIANQRETNVCLDASGVPVRRAMVWLDERAREQLPLLDAALGGTTIHRLTGKPLDLTPSLGRIAWLRDHEPHTYAQTAVFCDVQSYLVGRLTGSVATSWASADPSGLFDVEAREWSEPILRDLRISADRLPPTYAPGFPLGVVTEDAAAQSGLRAGTLVIAGGGDGQCAGLGTNCVSPGRAYLNLGTAIVSGVWSSSYQWARDWRTLLSASAEGYILETVQRSGAFLINWFMSTFGSSDVAAGVFADLERGASALPIGADGLLILPYFSGCMNPHWDPDARGCFIGLNASHGRYHFYRAILEGLTLESARGAAAIESAGIAIDEFVTIGGGAKSRLWVQMVADATNRPVLVCETVEASALGAAMLAAFGAGWYSRIADAATGMCGRTTSVEPEASSAERYRELMSIHGDLYAANANSFAAIKRFMNPNKVLSVGAG